MYRILITGLLSAATIVAVPVLADGDQDTRQVDVIAPDFGRFSGNELILAKYVQDTGETRMTEARRNINFIPGR